MKLKEGFVLRDIAGETVVLPSGDNLDLSKMISLNETAKFLWERLEQGATEEELVAALLAEYDVEPTRAQNSVRRFLETMEHHGFLI